MTEEEKFTHRCFLLNEDQLNKAPYNGLFLDCKYSQSGQFIDCKIQNLESYNTFRWSNDKAYDNYKIMIVKNDGSFSPLCAAYDSTQEVEPVLDWTYTQPKPENLIVAGYTD